MIIGSYERKGLSLPKEFKELWGKKLLLATLKRKEEMCIILMIEPESIRGNQLSDFLFWGSVEVDIKGKIKIPRWILERLTSYLKIKKEEPFVFVGCIKLIEIWQKNRWENYQRKYNYEEVLERVLGGP